MAIPSGITRTDLRKVKGLTQKQLDAACGDAKTRLPPGLKVATLRVGYVSAQAQWTRYPMADGTALTAPQLPSVVSLQRFARSEQKPLP